MPTVFQVLYKNISEVIWERRLTILVMALQSREDYGMCGHGGAAESAATSPGIGDRILRGYFFCR